MVRVTEGKLDARLATLPGRLKAELETHGFDMRLRRYRPERLVFLFFFDMKCGLGGCPLGVVGALRACMSEAACRM